MSGVAMATSKLKMPFSISAARSSAPTMSAPASRAACGGLAGGEHGDADVLAGTARQGHGATHHLVGLAGIDAEADGHVDGLVELGRWPCAFTRPSASVGVNERSMSYFLIASANFLPDM